MIVERSMVKFHHKIDSIIGVGLQPIIDTRRLFVLL